MLNDKFIEWAEKFWVLPAYQSVEEPVPVPIVTGHVTAICEPRMLEEDH